MIYLAVAMIFVGLMCFVYVALPPDIWGGSNRGRQEAQYRREMPRERQGRAYPPASTSHFQSRYPRMPIDPHQEDILRRERSIEANKPHLEEKLSQLNMVESAEISGNSNPVNQSELEEIPLHIFGFLYLDHLRQFPYDKISHPTDSIQEDWVKGLKRVGKGELTSIDGELVFSVKNLRSFYPADQLEQVVFYDQGFAVVPKDKDLPIPLFFTKEAAIFKEFLAASRKV